MRFFLPKAADPEEAEKDYQAIRLFVEEHCGPLSGARYRSVTFNHEGKLYVATVGEIEPLARDLVVAIFRQAEGSLFYLCTPSRGVIRGGPLLAGDVVQFEEFDAA
jgi:hypothetical protein